MSGEFAHSSVVGCLLSAKTSEGEIFSLASLQGLKVQGVLVRHFASTFMVLDYNVGVKPGRIIKMMGFCVSETEYIILHFDVAGFYVLTILLA